MENCCTSPRVAPLNSPTDETFTLGHTTGSVAEFRSKPPPNSKGCLFTSFEDVQLTDEERVFLNAAALGDSPIIRQSLEEPDPSLNINCVDYMGRSALHLAVDSENMETIELLLDKMSFENIEEALLHTISKGSSKIVKVIIEHPNYIAKEDQVRRSAARDPFFRTEEKSQFSPDITPLILAAHYNNHEIIQMFLARNHTIDRPHPIACQCHDCVTKQNYDSLKRSRSRLNAYRALASPAYMALSSPDPIMTTFELRQEMKKLAAVEKEFKNEYLSLVDMCMIFACELMDLCRGTQEVEAILSEGTSNDGQKGGDPLARLKMALEYEEKKFMAHPNCQQHLTTIWFGPELGFMQSLALWKNMLIWMAAVPLLPVLCIMYIISPESKLGRIMRCPSCKFIMHTISHLIFLILLAAATFRLEDKRYQINSTNDLTDFRNIDVPPEERMESLIKGIFRPANILVTHVQVCLVFYVLGLLWMECKQVYTSGVRAYVVDNYNWIDFTVLNLYISSYCLRFLVDHWIKQADHIFNATTQAYDALASKNYTSFELLKQQVFNDNRSDTEYYKYFMKASRFEWKMNDPEIVSDVLFAVANVISIARTTYLMPAFEVLGPLQISLGRMLGDITRFMVLFTLVLLAFMVGLHNLYWYYGTQTYKIDKDGVEKLARSSEAFQGMGRTLFSLFWSMFGQVPVDSVEIKYPEKSNTSGYASTFPDYSHSTALVEGVGLLLFAFYHVVTVIILINMLIAMMSHSFEAIQTDCDVEWKFARTRLWMNYIDEGNTLPVPFNMIPTPKSFRYAYYWLREVTGHGAALTEAKQNKRQAGVSQRRDIICQSLNIETPETNYREILQRLVRRYLFKLERQKEEGKDTVGMGLDTVFGATLETAQQPSAEKEANFADNEDGDQNGPADSNGLGPPGAYNARRRMSLRPGSGIGRSGRNPRKPSAGPGGGGCGPVAAAVQLLSLPQLDAMQRTLKLLDVRMQHVQANAKQDEQVRDDIQHIRLVMSENQKALTSIVTVLSALQEEVRALSISVHKQQQQRLEIQVTSKKDNKDGERPRKENGGERTGRLSECQETSKV